MMNASPSLERGLALKTANLRLRAADVRGFTLLELLTVVAIVVVLAGLILGGMGYAQQKAAASRAAAEIAALSNLIEAFKSDFGDYPKSTTPNTATAPPATTPDKGIAAFLTYSLFAYNVKATPAPGATSAMKPVYDWGKKNSWAPSGLSTTAEAFQLGTETFTLKYLIDPFGNPYGYSTSGTYNPTFQLWSTVGISSGTIANNEPRWIKNW